MKKKFVGRRERSLSWSSSRRKLWETPAEAAPAADAAAEADAAPAVAVSQPSLPSPDAPSSAEPAPPLPPTPPNSSALQPSLSGAHARPARSPRRRQPPRHAKQGFTLEQEWELKRIWNSQTFGPKLATGAVNRKLWHRTCGYLMAATGMSDCLFSAIDIRDNLAFSSKDMSQSYFRMTAGSPFEKLSCAFIVYDSTRDGHINASMFLKIFRTCISFFKHVGYTDEMLQPLRGAEKLLQTFIGDIDESADALGVSKSEFAERVKQYIPILDPSQSLSSGLHQIGSSLGKMLPIVVPGHPHWEKLQYLSLGIPLSVQRFLNKADSRAIDSHDWNVHITFELRTGQVLSSSTGDAFSSSPNKPPFHENAEYLKLASSDQAQIVSELYATAGEWTLTDYAPFVFSKLRDFFNIDSAAYARSLSLPSFYAGLLLGSLSNAPQQILSTGRSGSFLIRSFDQCYILKAIRESEFVFLFNSLLQPYYTYIAQCGGETLLPKFLGLYRLRNAGVSDLFILVMKNTFPREVIYEPIISEQFDLKGSTAGRTSKAADGSSPHGGALKDLDWGDRVMHVSQTDLDRFLRTLNNDCKFLEANQILDYSLLLGIHPVHHANDPLLAALNGDWDLSRWGGPKDSFGILSPDQPFAPVYFVGIVDILTRYDLLKMGEHTLKSIFVGSSSISCVPPNHYRNRFQKFLSSIVKASSAPKPRALQPPISQQQQFEEMPNSRHLDDPIPPKKSSNIPDSNISALPISDLDIAPSTPAKSLSSYTSPPSTPSSSLASLPDVPLEPFPLNTSPQPLGQRPKPPTDSEKSEASSALMEFLY